MAYDLTEYFSLNEDNNYVEAFLTVTQILA